MPKLQVLHLSGNSLTGSLPSDNAILSHSLTDLSLSYNHLTGTISSNIQAFSLPKLDLANNLFCGTLHSKNINSSQNNMLSLTNNRFSGPIPNMFLNMIDIDILEGNFFTCSNDNSNLPSHDHYANIYDCGSNIFNILYYIWLGLLIPIIIVGFWMWYIRKDIIVLVHQWIAVPLFLSTGDNIEINESMKLKLGCMIFLKRYMKTLEIIRKLSLYSAVFILIVLLPAYTVLSAIYRTHTYAYAWTVALMYLSGKTAFGISMSVLIILIVIQILAVITSFTTNPNQVIFDDNELVNDIEHITNQWKIWSMFTLYATLNLMIVGGANAAYVLVQLYESQRISLLSQILISIFKLMWNKIVSPAMVREMVRILSIKGIVQQSTLFFLQFVISIFNNIIIPCVVVIIISPNCFYHVFQQESDVISTYSFTSCSAYFHNGSCGSNYLISSTTSYSPPFTYSYQCSSAFITYYSPVFVFLCILSTFVFPMIQVLWIRWKLPNFFQFSRVFYPFDDSEVTVLLYIDQVYKVLVFELTFVGLLMTFGVIFPPLAVVFLLSILVSSYSHQAMIGRFLLATISSESHTHLDILEDNLKVQPMLSTIQKCGWFLLYTACCFYSLFLFDILGDSTGFYGAYWVLIVMPCVPLCIHILVTFMKEDDNQKKSNFSQDGIQLSAHFALVVVDVVVQNPLVLIAPIAAAPADIEREEESIIDIDVTDRDGDSIIA